MCIAQLTGRAKQSGAGPEQAKLQGQEAAEKFRVFGLVDDLCGAFREKPRMSKSKKTLEAKQYS